MQAAVKRKLKRDVEGESHITEVLLNLLNTYPEMPKNTKIGFADLTEEKGFAIEPISGAVIQSETEDVTGHVRQICGYPFYLVYRTATQATGMKISIKEFLDDIGRWLEKLTEYPTLPDGMRIDSIARTTPAILDKVFENNVQDWAIQLNLQYINEFER